MLQQGWSEANASPASRHGYRRLLHQSDGNHTSVEVYVSVISTLKHQRCRIFCFWKFVSLHPRSEEHTSELQSHSDLVCRLLLEKKKKKTKKKQKKINNKKSNMIT